MAVRQQPVKFAGNVAVNHLHFLLNALLPIAILNVLRHFVTLNIWVYISSFADGGKVHRRTGLKLCTGKEGGNPNYPAQFVIYYLLSAIFPKIFFYPYLLWHGDPYYRPHFLLLI
jgi:hypothetical protein